MNSWKCGALHSQPDIISSPNAACCKTSLVLACWEPSHRHILGRNKKNHWIIAQTGTLLYSFTKTPLLVERSEQWRKIDMAEFSSEGREETENDTSWLSLLTKNSFIKGRRHPKSVFFLEGGSEKLWTWPQWWKKRQKNGVKMCKDTWYDTSDGVWSWRSHNGVVYLALMCRYYQ